jgi:hypothetical protein
MKKIITYVTIILALIPINFILSQTTINLNPISYYAMIGDTVRVIVRINNVTNLHSVSVTVRFNNTIAKYLRVSNIGGITAGNWLGNQPTNQYITDSLIVDQALQGSGLSVSGTDTLFSIYFKALANGVSPVILKSLDMRDPNNNAISATLDSGHIFVGGITVNAKVFLQGPYNTGTGLMNNTLNTSGYLPLTQPYNTSPWNYNGTQSVPSGFFSSKSYIVDWILIELRKSTNNGSTFRRKTALIKNDGTIVDCIDGISPVFFGDTAAGNYYFVIRHRNHLKVMSAISIAMTNKTPLYDFTTSLSQFYGNDAQQVNTGIYALYAGDVSANDQIKYNGASNDRLPILSLLGGNPLGLVNGYYNEDVNMNGQVKYNGSNNDRLIILSNLGGNPLNIKNSNVPN